MTKQESDMIDRIQTQIGAGMQVAEESIKMYQIGQALSDLRSTREKLIELCESFRAKRNSVGTQETTVKSRRSGCGGPSAQPIRRGDEGMIVEIVALIQQIAAFDEYLSSAIAKAEVRRDNAAAAQYNDVVKYFQNERNTLANTRKLFRRRFREQLKKPF